MESLFNKVAGFQAVIIAKFLRTPILKTSANGCFCRLTQIYIATESQIEIKYK